MVHAGINACIQHNDGGVMFNKAAHFMAVTVVVRAGGRPVCRDSAAHRTGLSLEFSNRSRRRVGYANGLGNRAAAGIAGAWACWARCSSRSFIPTGIIFWVPSRFTGIPGPEMELEHGGWYITCLP